MPQTFGEWVREKRRAAGLTQAELAKRNSVTQGYISAIENAVTREITRNVARKFAATLGRPENEGLEAAGFFPEDTPSTQFSFLTAKYSVPPSAEELHNATLEFDPKKVLIIQGRNSLDLGVSPFLFTLRLSRITLGEPTKEGKTIVEQLDSLTDIGFAIVILTTRSDLLDFLFPDEIDDETDDGTLTIQEQMSLFFELGYVIAKLGRKRVVILTDNTIEIPSEFNDIKIIARDDSKIWEMQLAREMKYQDLAVDMNLL